MAITTTNSETAERVIQSVRDGETAALEAVHKFISSVNEAVPDVGEGDGHRQRIIDSAFEMTKKLVGTWSDVARHLAKVSQEALEAGKATKGNTS
jgi:hypothetical protein